MIRGDARTRIRRFVHRHLQQQIERETASMQVAR
jgi:hypothetical protein